MVPPNESSSLTPPAPGSAGRLGLIAGGGRFPILVAEAARRRGYSVACVGIRHEVSPEMADHVDHFKVLALGRFGAAIRFLRRKGVHDVSWAGWIRKERLFHPARILSLVPDWRLIRLWFFRLRDHQSQTLLSALADEFESEGMRLMHSTDVCPELLVEAGLHTRRAPNAKQLDDIRFGWKVAKRMADLDVGQSVAVFERSTIAVEGIEGTDKNILRAGELCSRSGFVVVKVAKERHDMRFDVPAVGPGTIETMRQAGARVLAVEAGRTILLDREELIEKANRWGIVVVAYSEGPPPADTCPAPESP